MTTALVNGKIFLGKQNTGEQWLTNHVVIIDGEKIVAICSADDLPAGVTATIDLQNQRLIPGLIDTQVNGGGGALFNDSPSVETLRVMGEAHRKFGTTGFYPTLISDDLSVVAKARSRLLSNSSMDRKVRMPITCLPQPSACQTD